MNWFVLTLMALTVYRLTRLIIKDTLPPVLWLRDHISGGWRYPTDKEHHHDNYPEGELEKGSYTLVPGLPGVWSLIDGEVKVHRFKDSWSPFWLAELWSCPWCVSGWIAGGVTAATDITIGLPAPVLQGVAVWALGAVAASREWL